MNDDRRCNVFGNGNITCSRSRSFHRGGRGTRGKTENEERKEAQDEVVLVVGAVRSSLELQAAMIMITMTMDDEFRDRKEEGGM